MNILEVRFDEDMAGSTFTSKDLLTWDCLENGNLLIQQTTKDGPRSIAEFRFHDWSSVRVVENS